MAAQVNEQPQTEVWYVDTSCSNHMCGNLKSNLLSAGQLQEKGYIITIQKGACEIYDPSRGAIVVVQMASNRLFPLKIDSVQSFLMAEVFLKFPFILKFVKNVLLANNIVLNSLKESREEQRMSWNWFTLTFAEKSEAFSAFKSFKARVEKETGRSIKILRTDRGGEYCSNEFEHFCDDQGIQRELTAAYTLQQNGVSERKNRTILNMKSYIFCSKHDTGGGLEWTETSCRSLQNFGCIAYAHVPDKKMKKLDDKGEKCVFLGQPTQVIFDNDAEKERQQLLQQQIPKVSIPESPPNDAPTAVETSSTTAENCDPITFQEAIKDLKWHKAMNEEIGSIEKNNSWELVELPKGQKSIGVKWVYKTKLNKDGGVDKYKARLVAKGYKQEFGVDYKEVFAPVAKLDTIRFVLSMAAQKSWSIHQLDVKSAFLHGELEEEVYIDQPPGYVKQGYENQVYKLKKALYGLKQAPRAWYSCIDAYFTEEGSAIICWCFHFSKKYALEILDKFMLKDCNSVNTPSEVGLKLSKSGAGKRVDSTLYKQIVGSLMYLTSTKPDIMHAVNLISRYMENPTKVHLLAAKRIFRYLKDSDYAGDLDDRKSTSRAVFMLNSRAITWSSKKQQIVTLSTTEAEFVAAASSSCQAIWLRRLLEVLYNQQQGPTVIYCDNLSTIKLSKNLVLHGRSKHIDVRYHFLHDLCKDGVIDLVFCKSEDQIADILTKPLKPAVFMKLRSMLGVCSSKEVVAASRKALQIDS
ncbi:Retrovirus-related Pol polyprotein from transposon RE2 [Vitis vinifera]|uniref:Retrovirus-related Pol polyprotein from transposon RE2 n=1 Tax=Vitis vinifera TaxID=29760 RepID=A0A438FWZ5_VITVI|nr:Retrovirus-related Pol polyprotein from transposon RE2 [Vitis vinifera]